MTPSSVRFGDNAGRQQEAPSAGPARRRPIRGGGRAGPACDRLARVGRAGLGGRALLTARRALPALREDVIGFEALVLPVEAGLKPPVATAFALKKRRRFRDLRRLQCAPSRCAPSGPEQVPASEEVVAPAEDRQSPVPAPVPAPDRTCFVSDIIARRRSITHLPVKRLASLRADDVRSFASRDIALARGDRLGPVADEIADLHAMSSQHHHAHLHAPPRTAAMPFQPEAAGRTAVAFTVCGDEARGHE
jgi:hypothetical protein